VIQFPSFADRYCFLNICLRYFISLLFSFIIF
jgi:hypothetical protein